MGKLCLTGHERSSLESLNSASQEMGFTGWKRSPNNRVQEQRRRVKRRAEQGIGEETAMQRRTISSILLSNYLTGGRWQGKTTGEKRPPY